MSKGCKKNKKKMRNLTKAGHFPLHILQKENSLHRFSSLYEINYFPVSAILRNPFRYTLIDQMNIFPMQQFSFQDKLLPYVIPSSFGIQELSSYPTLAWLFRTQIWRTERHMTAIDLNGLKT